MCCSSFQTQDGWIQHRTVGPWAQGPRSWAHPAARRTNRVFLKATGHEKAIDKARDIWRSAQLKKEKKNRREILIDGKDVIEQKGEEEGIDVSRGLGAASLVQGAHAECLPRAQLCTRCWEAPGDASQVTCTAIALSEDFATESWN